MNRKLALVIVAGLTTLISQSGRPTPAVEAGLPKEDWVVIDGDRQNYADNKRAKELLSGRLVRRGDGSREGWYLQTGRDSQIRLAAWAAIDKPEILKPWQNKGL
jgi:hypothetical protein